MQNSNQNLLVEYITLANHYNLEKKDYKKAIEYYEKYVELDKTKAVVFNILANLYSKVYGDNSLKRQLECYEAANLVKPNDRLILHGLAFCSEKLNRKEEADKYYKQLLQINPTPTDYYNYGGFLIHNGDFKNGHKYFAYRNLIDNEVFKNTLTPNIESLEKLKNIADKAVLVHYEQGFGDTIMYSRFVPALKEKAKKVIFVVQEELLGLIKNSSIFKNIIVISNKEDLSQIQYDLPLMLLDTPLLVNADSSNLPYADGYLEVNYNNSLNISQKFKIGIAYSGDKSANYSGRDVGIKFFKSLLKIDNVELYSLQKDADICEGIIPLGQDFKNFTDTACAIKNMDLIISTDNVILNLAGALGVRTIGLFNNQTNYRWFKLKDNTGWYKSIMPIQAKQQNDWVPVFEKLQEIVTEIVRNGK